MKKGAMVWVKYTIIPYIGKKPTKEDDRKFDSGCTFQLLSIEILNYVDDGSRYDFNALKNRKRIAGTD